MSFGKGESYASGIIPAFTMQGIESRDRAKLYITNKRIIIKGEKTTHSFTFRQMIDAQCHVHGLIFHIKNKTKPVILKYVQSGNHNVIGSIIFSVTAATQSSTDV